MSGFLWNQAKLLQVSPMPNSQMGLIKSLEDLLTILDMVEVDSDWLGGDIELSKIIIQLSLRFLS